jgi:hypothetical protein
MKNLYIPEDLLHIILDYDGRIKYKNGEYVNIIHKNDERYNIIKPLISKKIEIIKNIELESSGSGFYFEFGFDICTNIGLVYDYNFSYKNEFEICYFDFRDDSRFKQIRTYL